LVKLYSAEQGAIAVNRNRALIICVFAVALSAGLLSIRPAYAYRRHGRSYSYSAMRGRQQMFVNMAANAQLSAAKQVLSAAEATGSSAQSKLDTSLSKLREEAQKFHESQSLVRHAAKELAEIEQEILEEQKEDSPYAKAAKSVESARKKLKDIEGRILEEQSAKLQLSGLSGAKLAEERESILHRHTDWLEAKTNLEMEASELAHIRLELFKNDKHWKEAADTLVQARKDESAAEQMTHSGSSGRIGLTFAAKNAAEAAAVARAAMAQAEAVLRANRGGRYLNSPSASRNPPPPGYNK
jgi:DNA repair exonuclease SbcCD ATPase subunit